MDCPRCKLTNPPTALRCDCGYDFGLKKVQESYLTPDQQAFLAEEKQSRQFSWSGLFWRLTFGLVGRLFLR